MAKIVQVLWWLTRALSVAGRALLPVLLSLVSSPGDQEGAENEAQCQDSLQSSTQFCLTWRSDTAFPFPIHAQGSPALGLLCKNKSKWKQNNEGTNWELRSCVRALELTWTLEAVASCSGCPGLVPLCFCHPWTCPKNTWMWHYVGDKVGSGTGWALGGFFLPQWFRDSVTPTKFFRYCWALPDLSCSWLWHPE